LLQIGARDATQTPIAEQDGLVSARSHQCIVDAGRAKLVDDDRGPVALRRIKETLEKRCLSRAEKTGEYDDRNTRPAFASDSATEASGGG
jgi:hypothetical protein